MKSIKPTRQNVWRIPAVLNFTLGSTGAGIYIIGSMVELATSQESLFVLVYKLLSAVILITGLLFVALESGNPIKSRFLMYNVKKSWMSREVMGVYLFLLVVSIDLFYANTAIRVSGIILAIFVIVSHGMILYKAKGIPAWNVKSIVPLFVVSGLASGSAVLIILSAFLEVSSYYYLVTALFSLIASLLFWFIYIYTFSNPDFQISTKGLRGKKFMVLNVLIAHLIPAVGFIWFISVSGFVKNGAFTSMILILLSFLIVTGSFFIRYGIIISSGLFKQVTIYKK